MGRIANYAELRRMLMGGRPFTAVYLAEWLGCSERTIRRYLAKMRDHEGLPLEFDREGRTWRLTNNVGPLPASAASAEDRFALLLLRQALSQFEGTPWHKQLGTLCDRLLSMVPRPRVSDYDRIAERVVFEGSRVSHVRPDVWTAVLECIELGRTLAMDYLSAATGRTDRRRVDPYGLVVRNREWYLVGWDHSARDVRTFLLARARSAEATDRACKVRDGFDLKRYQSTAVDGHQSMVPTHTIVLRYTREGTPAGEDFIWNDTQRKSRDDEGRLTVEFETAALYAVERMVLGWGGKVEVLAPSELVARLAESTRRLAALYAR